MQSVVRRRNTHHHTNARPAFFRPQLESLETRNLLATSIWTGNSFFSPNWTDAANWANFRPPSLFDDVVFPANAARHAVFNDYVPDIVLGSITFASSSGFSGGYDLAGSSVRLLGGIVDASGFRNIINFARITLDAAQTFDVTAPRSLLGISSPVDLNRKTLTLSNSIAFGGSFSDLTDGNILGPIGNDGAIVKTGVGAWILGGNNSYTGLTTINQGLLAISHNNALGSPAAGTVVNTGGSLAPLPAFPPAAITVPEPLTLNGAGSATVPAALALMNLENFYPNFTGPITLGSNSTIVAKNASPTFIPEITLSAPIISNGFKLNVEGNLKVILNAATSYNVVLNGTSSFSQINVTGKGTVELGGSSLDVALNFTTAAGDAFPIIDSASRINGFFKDMPEGATLTINGQLFVIHYVNPEPGRLLESSQVILERPRPAGGGGGGGQPISPGKKIYVTAADAGGGPDVKVFDAVSGAVLFNFFAYDQNFTGGVRIAVGDVTGDRLPDIVTAAGPGGGPNVTVFDGGTGQRSAGPLGSFFAYDQNFTGGVYVAAGDVNADGFADIICGADGGGGPNITVFSGKDGAMLKSFFAYDQNFTGGVRVAAGDVNGDGFADVICGAGPGGGPNVTVFSGKDTALLVSFFAYDMGFTPGIFVSAGDLDGDGKADVITGAGPGGGPNVATFRGLDGAALLSFFPYDAGFAGGVRVASADRNGDGKADILTTPGPGGGPDMATFNGQGNLLDRFFAYDPLFTGGLFVAGMGR